MVWKKNRNVADKETSITKRWAEVMMTLDTCEKAELVSGHKTLERESLKILIKLCIGLHRIPTMKKYIRKSPWAF